LQELDLYDRTLIAVVSDHGEHLTEHGYYFTHAMPYVETLHVPLLLKFPDSRFAGRVVDAPVSTLDLLPTICEEVGLMAPDGIQGRSLLPLLRREEWFDRPVVAEQGALPQQYSKALIDWPWKLLLIRSGNHGILELYNLERDPEQTEDLSVSQPEVLERLHGQLWEILDRDRPVRSGPEEAEVELDPATKRKLKSLGY
jgi:arylsulfatase A-like enzyme